MTIIVILVLVLSHIVVFGDPETPQLFSVTLQLMYGKAIRTDILKMNMGEDLIEVTNSFCLEHAIGYQYRNQLLETAVSYFVKQFKVFIQDLQVPVSIDANSEPGYFLIQSSSELGNINCELIDEICDKITLQYFRYVWNEILIPAITTAVGCDFNVTTQLRGNEPSRMYHFEAKSLISYSFFLNTITSYCKDDVCFTTVFEAASDYRSCLIESIISPVSWDTWVVELRLENSKLLAASKLVIYIGGNEGSDLEIMLGMIPDALFFVYEPVEAFVQVLQAKFGDNNRVKILHTGVGASDGIACWSVDGVATQEVRAAEISASKEGFTNDLHPITCGAKRNATALILHDLRHFSGVFTVHMNCEGCEFEVIESWLQHDVMDRIGLLQFGTHRADWVENNAVRLCELRRGLKRTHEMSWGKVWNWERWVPVWSTWMQPPLGNSFLLQNDSDGPNWVPPEKIREIISAESMSVEGFVSLGSASASSIPAAASPVQFKANKLFDPGRKSQANTTAFYTVFCGSATNTKNKVYPSPKGVPSFFLTDNAQVAALADKLGWTIIRLPGSPDSEPDDANMKCKLPRTHPHLYYPLDDYKYLVYADATYVNTYRNFSQVAHHIDLLDREESSDDPDALTAMAIFQMLPNVYKRPLRDVRDLVDLTLDQPRYRKKEDDYRRYIQNKMNEGYHGREVLCGGFIIRRMQHPLTRIIGAHWYSEILQSGINDEVSLAFVYEKYAAHIRILGAHGENLCCICF